MSANCWSSVAGAACRPGTLKTVPKKPKGTPRRPRAGAGADGAGGAVAVSCEGVVAGRREHDRERQAASASTASSPPTFQRTGATYQRRPSAGPRQRPAARGAHARTAGPRG